MQKPHPPIWVGGESRPAMRRTAELATGWYPLGVNPTYPMADPEQLEAGIARIASYARRFGREPSDINIIYRIPSYELHQNGTGPASSAGERTLFTGRAEDIAGDIRRYQAMGVSHLVVDFARLNANLDDMMRIMEQMATQVWPRV